MKDKDSPRTMTLKAKGSPRTTVKDEGSPRTTLKDEGSPRMTMTAKTEGLS